MTLSRFGPVPVKEGNRGETPVEDDEVAGLLNQMLNELKINNLHMKTMTNDDFDKQDVE